VLEKMASPDFGSELGKRVNREGERRTSSIPVGSAESERVMAAVDRGHGEKGAAPAFNRQQSWNQKDMKRVMTERLMGPVDDEDGGYSSAGGGTWEEPVGMWADVVGALDEWPKIVWCGRMEGGLKRLEIPECITISIDQ
jgi:hypothetical protein